MIMITLSSTMLLLCASFIIDGVMAASSNGDNQTGWSTGSSVARIIIIIVVIVVIGIISTGFRMAYRRRRPYRTYPINLPPRGRNFRAPPPFPQPPPLQPIPPIPFPVPSIPPRINSPTTTSFAPPMQPPRLPRSPSSQNVLLSPLESPEASTLVRAPTTTTTTSSYLTPPQHTSHPPITSFSSPAVEPHLGPSSFEAVSTAGTTSLREEMASHQKQLISEQGRIKNIGVPSDPPPQYSE